MGEQEYIQHESFLSSAGPCKQPILALNIEKWTGFLNLLFPSSMRIQHPANYNYCSVQDVEFSWIAAVDSDQI